MHIFKNIHNGDITLEDIEKEQIELKKDLDHMKPGHRKDESPEQKKIKNLYNSREEVVPMFNDYAKNMSKYIYESKQEGAGLRIIVSKQMFQRLPLLLSEISAGNNSESLLNEVRQIVYSLYRSKEIIKKNI